ncbi:MAG: hypothetical protein IJF43_02420, partial [Firmicutes bacterium]|nr:hypothetical protein [Bacillota bacterium]
MKKSMLALICVLLCMFAFTAGVSAETILPDIPAFDGAVAESEGVSVLNTVSGDMPYITVKVSGQIAGIYESVPVIELKVYGNEFETYYPEDYTEEFVDYAYGMTFDDLGDNPVSMLDVLVAFHAHVYGDAFKSNPSEYFDPGYGFVGKMFGSDSSSNGYSLNGDAPNFGVPFEEGSNYWLACGVHQAQVKDGDIVEMFQYSDPYGADYYTWFEQGEERVLQIEMSAGESISLNVKGFQFGKYSSMIDVSSHVTDLSNSVKIGLYSSDGIKELTGDLGSYEIAADGAVSVTINESGDHFLVAYDANTNEDDQTYILSAAIPVSVGSSNPVIESGVYLGITKSNGSVDQVIFTDANGQTIEGIEVSFSADEKIIDVLLPKDYEVNGTVKAVFTLTQNSEGAPFLSTKNKASGSSSGKAVNNKFTEKAVTLSKGAATFEFYLYDIANPKATTNFYDTYTIRYKV